MDLRPPLVVLALLCACSGAEQPRPAADGGAVAADTRPLDGGLASLEAVGAAAVAGLNTGDAGALAGLLLSEADFTGRLFDALSNHPNARQMGPDLIFALQRRESEDELTRAIARLGGQDWRFLALEPGAVEVVADLTLHRRPLLRVEDARGERLGVELLGTVVEHRPSRTFKLLSYRLRE